MKGIDLHKITNFLRKLSEFEPFLAFILVIVTDLIVKLRLFRDFLTHPLANGIAIIVLYVFLLLLLHIINRLLSYVELRVDGEVKSELEEIVSSSRVYLFLVSPYLSPGNALTEKILTRAREGIKIKIFINSSQLQSYEAFRFFERFSSLGGEMWYHPNLHAKVYLNEQYCLISSLNLLTSSFDNSFESGIATDNKRVRRDTKSYILKTLLISDLTRKVDINSFQIRFGYCIRTRQKIAFNPSKPIEYNEFRNSSGGNNSTGIYCHFCGEKAITSIDNPFCEKHQEYRNLKNNNIE